MSISVDKEYGVGLIVCDIEGCLNAGKTRVLDIQNLKRLSLYNRDCISTGKPFLTLMSGRQQPFVEAYANLLAVYTPCICENGALAYFPGEDRLLYHETITSDVIRAVESCRSRVRSLIANGLEAQIEAGKEICISVNPIKSSRGTQLSVNALFEILHRETNLELLEVTHSMSAVDITPKGINKASGLTWLSRLYDLDVANMIGIGDSRGDLGFLKAVGYSGGPANSSQEVRDAVMYVSPENYVLGVIDIIDHFLNSLEREFDESPRH